MKPRIRLKGFEGEWKLTSFGRNVKLRRGLTYSPTDVCSNGIRVLRSSNIDEDTFVVSKDDVFVNDKCVNIPFANQGDILITAANGSPRLVGKHCLIKTDDMNMVHGGFMLLASSPESAFYNASMGSGWYTSFKRIGISGGNGAIGNLDKTELENFKLYIPNSRCERDGLANYFKSLDELIQSTTQKVASLKQLKEASLISMFPQGNETTPRVRFKGFEGEWEKKQLEACLTISCEKNTDNSFGFEDVLSVSDEFGVMNQIELLGRSYAGKSVSNYGILKKGEIVYTKSPLKSKPYGIIKLNSKKTGIVSVLYAVYIPKDNVCAEYIHYYFAPDWRLNNYLRPLVRKGAKNTMNISDETALKGEIMIPIKIEEQQHIASYFNSLDTQITLQEQRLEKLKQLKSACLDQMFV